MAGNQAGSALGGNWKHWVYLDVQPMSGKSVMSVVVTRPATLVTCIASNWPLATVFLGTRLGSQKVGTKFLSNGFNGSGLFFTVPGLFFTVQGPNFTVSAPFFCASWSRRSVTWPVTKLVPHMEATGSTGSG